mmetsp:Transcript_45266/g.102223  ORF Transcript_45266/g.102223 Transcript_45266/m.102223 type:complete len:125 (+) Transcript_45266:1794-2168(+)
MRRRRKLWRRARRSGVRGCRHADGTTTELLRRHSLATPSPADEKARLATIHVEKALSSPRTGGPEDPWAKSVLARAVLLDLRPREPQSSLHVIWDARTNHQGHEFAAHNLPRVGSHRRPYGQDL